MQVPSSSRSEALLLELFCACRTRNIPMSNYDALKPGLSTKPPAGMHANMALKSDPDNPLAELQLWHASNRHCAWYMVPYATQKCCAIWYDGNSPSVGLNPAAKTLFL
jgi:hypothetical protein